MPPKLPTNGTCRLCGRSVFWAKNIDTGKAVPLDPDALIYRTAGHRQELAARVKDEHLYVTHFATCIGGPNAIRKAKPAIDDPAAFEEARQYFSDVEGPMLP